VLAGAGDVERIVARIALQSARPRDLARLRDTLNLLPEIGAVLKAIDAPMVTDLATVVQTQPVLANLLTQAIVPVPPVVLRDGGVIQEGFDSALDELKAISEHAAAFLIKLETEEREQTGLSSLKVGYNRVHGYYIE